MIENGVSEVTPRRWIGLAILVAIAAVPVVLLIDEDPPPRVGTLLVRAKFPAALAPLPDGSLLYAERLTGRIRLVTPDGRLAADPLAVVEVSTAGQRGLLGVAAAGDEVFASWTDEDRRLVVGRVSPGPVRLVWRGPPSADLGNGGRIAPAPDGSLLVGVGDLERRDRIDDPAAPNGKILRLDADGAPGQEPRIVSSGWNNPFAFLPTPDGGLWVADNEPGDLPERIARVSPGGEVSVTETLAPHSVPTGIVRVGDELYVCTFEARTLYRFLVSEAEVEPASPETVGACALGVATLPDGRLAVAFEDEIRLVRPPS